MEIIFRLLKNDSFFPQEISRTSQTYRRQNHSSCPACCTFLSRRTRLPWHAQNMWAPSLTHWSRRNLVKYAEWWWCEFYRENTVLHKESIMASSFMCNVLLLPKLEIHNGKLSKEWKQRRQVWDAYEEVADLRSTTSHLRVAAFITCIGKEACKIHNGLPFRSEEEKSDITKVLKLWEMHYIGKPNIIYSWYKFNNSSQEQTESIDTYMTALWALTETYEFGTFKEHLIRDRIVCGVRENAVRRKLLQESGPTPSKCVDICPAAEATSAQLKEMALSQHSSEVDLVVKAEHKKPNSRKEKMKSPKDQLVEECKLCGRQHERNRAKCPVYGQICSLCGKLNHFAVKCGNKSSDSKKSSQKSKHRKVYQLADSDDSSYSSEEEILSLSSQNAVNTVEMSNSRVKYL